MVPPPKKMRLEECFSNMSLDAPSGSGDSGGGSHSPTIFKRKDIMINYSWIPTIITNKVEGNYMTRALADQIFHLSFSAPADCVEVPIKSKIFGISECEIFDGVNCMNTMFGITKGPIKLGTCEPVSVVLGDEIVIEWESKFGRSL